MEILEQSEGGAMTIEGVSKLVKRPMSACSHQSRKPTRKSMKPRRADPKAAPQTQDPLLHYSHENQQVVSFAHMPTWGEGLEGHLEKSGHYRIPQCLKAASKDTRVELVFKANISTKSLCSD